jgi:hypothetical protein
VPDVILDTKLEKLNFYVTDNQLNFCVFYFVPRFFKFIFYLGLKFFKQIIIKTKLLYFVNRSSLNFGRMGRFVILRLLLIFFFN